MPVIPSDYRPIIPFRNGHVNSISSKFLRQPDPVPFSRKRIDTPDGDFLDIDFLQNRNPKIAVLCHGLEGSSSSQYMLGLSGLLNANGFDIAAMNYRFCSGEVNRKLRTYHSGETEDLNTVIHQILPDYDEIYLVGFSLGGNIVLKYSGDGIYPINPKIKAVSATSVLVDLYAGAKELSKLKNRIYSNRFLKTLKEKIRLKHNQYPEDVNIERLKEVNSLIDFDEIFTSSINGFENARDYYSKCNSKQFLMDIRIPTLIINARDDPFMPSSCYPVAEAKESKYLNLMTPSYGGHVGFFDPRKKYYWHEEQILDFFKKPIFNQS